LSIGGLFDLSNQKNAKKPIFSISSLLFLRITSSFDVPFFSSMKTSSLHVEKSRQIYHMLQKYFFCLQNPILEISIINNFGLFQEKNIFSSHCSYFVWNLLIYGHNSPKIFMMTSENNYLVFRSTFRSSKSKISRNNQYIFNKSIAFSSYNNEFSYAIF